MPHGGTHVAINVVNSPLLPLCDGNQWIVHDYPSLVVLTGYVMLGRAQQAANILQGAQAIPPIAHPVLKARLERELVLAAGEDPWHRDGLLFETICWLIAGMQARPDEVISDPHRKATQQGADTIKVAFDL